MRRSLTGLADSALHCACARLLPHCACARLLPRCAALCAALLRCCTSTAERCCIASLCSAAASARRTPTASGSTCSWPALCCIASLRSAGPLPHGVALVHRPHCSALLHCVTVQRCSFASQCSAAALRHCSALRHCVTVQRCCIGATNAQRSTGKLWQPLNIGKSPTVPGNLIISGAVHAQISSRCLGVVCQTLPALRHQQRIHVLAATPCATQTSLLDLDKKQ